MDQLIPVGPAHNIGGVIHVQILRDKSTSDPNRAFQAQINAPGFSEHFQIADGASKDLPIPVQLSPTLHVEVDNFTLLPAGSTSTNASALSFLLVFKIKEVFMVTIGSVPVTASLH